MLFDRIPSYLSAYCAVLICCFRPKTNKQPFEPCDSKQNLTNHGLQNQIIPDSVTWIKSCNFHASLCLSNQRNNNVVIQLTMELRCSQLFNQIAHLAGTDSSSTEEPEVFDKKNRGSQLQGGRQGVEDRTMSWRCITVSYLIRLVAQSHIQVGETVMI